MALVGHAQAQSAIISDGVVTLGVNGPASLNAPGTTPPPPLCNSGVTTVGVRYVPTGCEATADGCTCEGWGAAYNGAVEGCADTSNCGGMMGMTMGSFSATATTALSVTHIGDLQVTHDFHPSAITPKLYQVNVTLLNQGTTPMTDVTYRRSMDWDIEPTPFSEYSGLETISPPPPALLHSCLTGFVAELIVSNPIPSVCTGPGDCFAGMGPPDFPDVIDSGVCDHGAMFDFDFDTLDPGSSRSFSIYFGAGDDDTDARNVLGLISAQVWSLGKCSAGGACDASTDPSGHIHGGPQTFIFAFNGLSPTISVAPEFSWVFTETSPDDLTLDPVQYTDLTSYIATPGSGPVTLTWSWDLGDSTSSTAQNPVETYSTAGVYNVCLTATASLDMYAGVTATGTICHDVLVHNRAPHSHIANIGGRYGANVFDRSNDEDGTVVAMAWTFGDGSGAAGARPPIHRYDRDGWYTVCLTVTDDLGATDLSCVDVYYQVPVQDVDSDGDGIQDYADNCPTVPNHDQEDGDFDGVGDACTATASGGSSEGTDQNPWWNPAADRDHDGIADLADNCPTVANHDQADLDGDRTGDVCDKDLDGDGVPEQGPTGAILDNCPATANSDQADLDHNGVGDGCQATPVREPSGVDAGASAQDASAAATPAPAPVGWQTPLLWAAAAFAVTAAILLPVGLRRRGA